MAKVGQLSLVVAHQQLVHSSPAAPVAGPAAANR